MRTIPTKYNPNFICVIRFINQQEKFYGKPLIYCAGRQYLSERAGEAPETAEPAGLQVVQLLLTRVLAGYHVLDDALHRAEDHLVVAHLQNTSQPRVQQAVTVTYNK